MQEFIKMSVIAATVVAISALMITSAFAPAAYAREHHHHSSVSIHVSQKIHQENNGCSDTCVNVGINNINTGNQFSNNS